nr:hypothetical protein; 34983-33172 [Arabidopsis thaliana]
MKTNRNRPINILIVFFLLTTARAATRNWTNRTHRTVPKVQHAYYAYPHRSCESFSRPYARSMCIELERIHRSSRQPLFSPPPPPTEIDQRYEKLSEKIVSWEDKKRKKAKRKLHRTERSVEKTKLKATQRFRDENERIEIIVASARAHAYESRIKEELKVKEKANLMRTTGRKPSTCL